MVKSYLCKWEQCHSMCAHHRPQGGNQPAGSLLRNGTSRNNYLINVIKHQRIENILYCYIQDVPQKRFGSAECAQRIDR